MTQADEGRWRTRMPTLLRRVLLLATAVAHVTVGFILLVLLVSWVAELGAGGWAGLVWAALALGTTWGAVRSTTPALRAGEQSWNEYVLRATLIGSERVRPVPVRILTGLVLGGPLGLVIVVYGIIDALGSLGL
jgi:hypothetical protein